MGWENILGKQQKPKGNYLWMSEGLEAEWGKSVEIYL